MTGLNFFLSSAAVVTVLSKLPGWATLIAAIPTAVINGYQIAVNQDNKIKTAAKLHVGWLQLEWEYDHLWSHLDDEDAETRLATSLNRERELSEIAATEIGHNEKLWLKWLDIVHKKNETTEHDREEDHVNPREADRPIELASITNEGTQSSAPSEKT